MSNAIAQIQKTDMILLYIMPSLTSQEWTNIKPLNQNCFHTISQTIENPKLKL